MKFLILLLLIVGCVKSVPNNSDDRARPHHESGRFR